MAHNVAELMVVLENLTYGRHHGESCACPGAASRVVVQELLVWSSSVCQLEGWADGGLEDAQRRAWWCPVVLGSHSARDDAVAPGMVAQWQGWPHKAGSDGGDALRWSDVREQAQGRRPYPFRGFTVLFQGVRCGGGTGVGSTFSWS
jgi:hypothetical protein